ncbi:TPA: hypothetical protein ACOP2N_004716 [Salmonella enterica]|nr:hypothetical protein [Salmonella enterica]EBZ4888487.1 hypothetical protein [Salmonella enterica subsp. enterica serovar Bredeney]EDR9399219.1 hypothetical protein [Salmonella enterica subsp. enterica]EDT6893229.1 hypothetical protein [Salmonella enterica subsp. enterica serovar Javiana]EDX5193566.1 hypothetical protein [Salmonella enterica subsp. enterica serovar Glostrup]
MKDGAGQPVSDCTIQLKALNTTDADGQRGDKCRSVFHKRVA